MPAYSYLTPDNIFDRYDESLIYTRVLTKPFQEFERIARNLPHPSIDKRYPRTTDGTTASIIRKTPRRIIQQLPTAKVVDDANDWMSIVASFIFQNKIIPKANEEYSLLQKSWSVVEKSLTFGATATYTPFLNKDGDFLPDVTIPYWGDVFLQKGKKSGYDCSFVFLRSWWQKADLEALIAKESSAKKKSKDYESSWDVKALKKILSSESTKDALAMTPTERERMANTSGIEIVTGFQIGVGSTFYSFNPQTKLIVRTKDNLDPRGKMPIDWMYGDIDGSNPFGRGIIELVGSLQNLIDSDMQMYQFNRALMLAPPIIKKGNFSKKKIVYEPNAIIDLGTDQNASVEALMIDTSAVVNYPSLYGLQKSQLLNLTSSPDTSISADVGNPGFSKTSAGVAQQQGNISVDDNFVRKMFEVWYQCWGETAINIYFANRTGVEDLQLDEVTAMKLRELTDFDESQINDQNIIRINYDDKTEPLKFKVDPSTTAIQDKASQVASATSLLDMVMQYPMLNSNFGGPIDIDVLSRRIVINSGIDDPEEVAPEPTAAQIQSKQEQKNTVSAFSPTYDKPSIKVGYTDLPPAAQVQLLSQLGYQVTIQDVLAGPVADPNIRGVMNPIVDPNVLVPGGQPAVQASPTQAPVAGAVQQVAQNQPQPMPTGQMDTQTLPQSAQAPQMPQPIQQPTPQPQAPQTSPHDAAIVAQLRQLGFSDQIIQEAIEMLNNGYSDQQVLQALSAIKGGK